MKTFDPNFILVPGTTNLLKTLTHFCQLQIYGRCFKRDSVLLFYEITCGRLKNLVKIRGRNEFLYTSVRSYHKKIMPKWPYCLFCITLDFRFGKIYVILWFIALQKICLIHWKRIFWSVFLICIIVWFIEAVFSDSKKNVFIR